MRKSDDDGAESTAAELVNVPYSADELKLDPKAKAQTVDEYKLLATVEAMNLEYELVKPLAASNLFDDVLVEGQEDMEILGLKREAAVRRWEDEISVHKATLRRARLGTARDRLEFDDVDFCWPSPPRGRLVWDED